MSVLAIDIGGTKLAAGIVHGDGSLVDARTCPTPSSGVASAKVADAKSAEAIFDAVVALCDGLEGFDAVGVGCGGPMTPGVGGR